MGREPVTRIDGDGVRILEDRRARLAVRLVGAAAALIIGGAIVAVVLIRRAPAAPDVALASPTPPPAASPMPVAAPTPGVAATPGPPATGAAVSLRLRKRDAAGATTTPTPPANVGTLGGRDAILALRAAGEQGGIAAFGLPGTDPPKPGVIVPDDFELPPGYVRHYQTTDDGRQLPPVLMLHPDYELVDADGRVVPLPAGRIVPPELAPPGMPVQTLKVPEPADPSTDTEFRR